MPSKSAFPALFLATLLGTASHSLIAATYTISSASDFGSLPATLEAGDEILINDGTGAFTRPGVGRTGLARTWPSASWDQGDLFAAARRETAEAETHEVG